MPPLSDPYHSTCEVRSKCMVHPPSPPEHMVPGKPSNEPGQATAAGLGEEGQGLTSFPIKAMFLVFVSESTSKTLYIFCDRCLALGVTIYQL
jgi:hypothetical protein